MMAGLWRGAGGLALGRMIVLPAPRVSSLPAQPPVAQGTPRRHLRNSDIHRSQSAAEAPRRAERPLFGSHTRQGRISHTQPSRAKQQLTEAACPPQAGPDAHSERCALKPERKVSSNRSMHIVLPRLMLDTPVSVDADALSAGGVSDRLVVELIAVAPVLAVGDVGG
jgi:hypothetical protein